ncbi:hypothetical protein [Photobacterium galatheae]|uniref:Uncharacterized protein n=1 Tax=Photobacterium galatheae TaxID=1654360 RepID=A0A066RHC7_9GAMM|nr:hypothetical protein [Photobacterium galatheae]KDM89684.1 hypothetical protein EA58_20985 [Photobacterium galatheae]
MLSKRKIKQIFPLDFYGEDGSWRFILRAYRPEEVLDAMYWRAYISCHRKEFDLLHLATDKFNYKYNYSASDVSELHLGAVGSPMRVNMMGPIVSVSTLLAYLAEKRSDKTASASSQTTDDGLGQLQVKPS